MTLQINLFANVFRCGCGAWGPYLKAQESTQSGLEAGTGDLLWVGQRGNTGEREEWGAPRPGPPPGIP